MHSPPRRARSVSLAVGLLLALAAAGARAAEAGAWARLGPPGPQAIVALAVGPEWPRERLLLAARQDLELDKRNDYDLVRSGDGGATWERLAAPAERVFLLLLSPSAGADRPAFAAAGSPGYPGPKALYRSPDAGGTWQQVLAVSSLGFELSLSPDFARDGLALVIVDGRLHRSRDGGLSWEALDPAPGQRVLQAAFSPG